MHANVIMERARSCALPKTAYCIIMVLCTPSVVYAVVLCIPGNLGHLAGADSRPTPYGNVHLVTGFLSDYCRAPLVTESRLGTQSNRTCPFAEVIRAGGTASEPFPKGRLRTVESHGCTRMLSPLPRHVAAFRGVSVFPPGGNDDE